MRAQLKSLYLDTQVGIYFYNRPETVAGILLMLPGVACWPSH